MASLTVARPDVFPDGTDVGAYARQLPKFPEGSGAPVGTAVASGTVSSGSVALTGLADGTRYAIAGQVGGVWRRIYMFTPEVGTGLTALQTSASVTSGGLPHPALRKRRRALGLV